MVKACVQRISKLQQGRKQFLIEIETISSAQQHHLCSTIIHKKFLDSNPQCSLRSTSL